ncbi:MULTISPECIES: hypothetical protein [unclassified Ornithinimicrobium]|uniref:hypothetical protein n=1 Tax=unclassified Ornithinimicrobium TaxID=2615080 RepID=UPI003851FF55
MICHDTARTGRPRIAVLTMVSGEHDHLLSHVDGLAVSTWPPDVHVVTSIRDRALTRGRLPIASDRWTTVVPVLPVPPSRDAFLPGLHAAGRAALEGGADVLIFLSVSCIPSRRLLQVLAQAATCGQSSTPTLWHSVVDGLAPAPSVGYPVAGDLDAFLGDRAHTPGPTTVPGRRWCDSFAMTARDWRLVMPRVHASHPYDGAPTDVEDVITASSGRFRQVTGATAYLQHPLRREVPMPATA